MDEPGAGVQPQTLALDTLIRETIARTRASAECSPADTMLFLGNRHQSFPARMVQDPVLEPVDKLVWMVILLAVSETASAIAFPSYEAIGRQANVASRSTIARAIAILRATRWLTLCARVRTPAGQFRGNVYALHDEPLPLADALHLDCGYMAFLGDAQAHGHARVRAVAKGVLDAMDEAIQAGLDVTAPEHPLERRIRALAMTEERGGARRYFAFTENTVRPLWNVPGRQSLQASHHDQNSNSGPRSSSYIYKTTTTKKRSKFDITGEAGCALVYPQRLAPNHREVAARYLHRIAPQHRQPVLDELEGRCRAQRKGMAPLYDELRFLHALCRAVQDGKFQPNLGIRIGTERSERERARQRAVTAAKDRRVESDAQRVERMAGHRRGMARIKELVGLGTSTEKQPLTSESSSK